VARGHSKNRQPAKEAAGAKTTGSGPGAKPDREVDSGTRFQAVLLCAGIVFWIALVLYGWTLAPTVTLVDSGELIVVAHYLGVAHPPGFPLWTMLAHVASLMPWGNVAVRVNFASALFAALASAMLTLVVAELMIIASYVASRVRVAKKNPRQNKRTRSDTLPGETDAGSDVGRLLVLGPAIGAGLLMAFSRTLWSYATIAEVYSLNTLLILLVFFLMLRWRRCIVETRRRVGAAQNATTPAVTAHDALLYAGALVFGVALGVHHVTLALTLPAVGIIVYRTEGLRFFASRRLWYAALVSLGGLFAVYAYLPLAMSRTPIISWGNPRSFQEIWWHMTGRQYQVFFAFTPKEVGDHFVEFGRMALREFGVWWAPFTLVLAVAGFGTLFKRDRTTFWFLALVVGADLAYALGYDIAEDKDAYYLPAFISIALAAAFGLRWVIQFCAARPWPKNRVYFAVALSLLLASGIALAGNWPFNNRRHYFIAKDYVENLLGAIEPNGLLLTFDWEVASPMLYVQEVEQRRRDVKVVDVNLLRRPWYFDYLRYAYPDLVERSRDKIDAFTADLKAWERDPKLYAVDPVLNRRITALFQEMLQAMVTNENRIAPVYITSDVPFADKRDSELTKWINKTYQLVPEGLVFKLESDPTFHDSRDVRLVTRGLADGTLRFEKDDVVNLKVSPVYTTMLVNRGRYLALFNQHERAIAAFQQALTLSPDLALAKKGLEESRSKLRSP
jgi:tetratricopeptide (TPR) repeat protein